MLNGDAPEFSEEASAAYRRLSETSPTVERSSPFAEKSSAKRKLDKREGSYAGITPLSDITLKVKQFLLYFLTEDQRTAGKSIEIEAKLGRILDGGQRIDQAFPVITATVLHPNYPCTFQADMSTAQHKAFNQHLNAAVEESNRNKTRRPIIYKHTYMTDTIYKDRKRVTTNDKTGEVVEVIRKEKIDNLHILSPNTPFDLRISVNLEHPAEKTGDEGEPMKVRKKDRLTYTHQNYQMDLTQVKSPGSATTHELEIELTNVDELLKQARYESQGLDNHFESLIEGFMGTVTQLTRASTSFAE